MGRSEGRRDERPAPRLTSLDLHFTPETDLGRLDEIVLGWEGRPPARRSRARHWKTNARTDVFAAVLALLVLRGRGGPERAVLDSRNGRGEQDLCAKLHDLWHSPRKRIESHWLDAVFDEGTEELPSPLAVLLERSGGRMTCTVRLRSGTPRVTFYKDGEVVPDRRLRSFLQANFAIAVPEGDERSVHPCLPAYGDEFVGREGDLEEVATLVRTNRLVTLVGPPGVGKTRLAIEVAARISGDGIRQALVRDAAVRDAALRDAAHRDAAHRDAAVRDAAQVVDGIEWVDLEIAQTERDVVVAFARVLWGDSEKERPPEDLENLVDRLRTRRVLILLDNCETALDPVGRLLGRVLEGPRGASFLATSIESIGVRTERCHIVQPLPVPGVEVDPREALRSPAVRLFRSRSEASGVPIEETRETIVSILGVCRFLGGLPLGIELAAASLHRFGLSELTELLERHLELVRSADRSGPVRHESLHSVVEWTYSLLSESERQVLACLAVFPSDWSTGSVGPICEGAGLSEDESLAAHARLAQRNVVSALTPATERRWTFLPFLRAFARRRLEEHPLREAVVESFERHFLERLESLSTLPSESLGDATRQLVPEADNLRSGALSALRGGRTERALQFALNLERLWLAMGTWSDGIELCRELLSASGLDTKVTPRVSRLAASLEYRRGDIASARTHYQRSLDLAEEVGDANEVAHALHGLGTISFRTGQLDDAESYFQQASRTWSDRDDERLLLNVWNNLAAIAATQGRLDAAAERFSRVIEMARRLGERRTLGSVLMNYGIVQWRRNDLDAAMDCLERGLEVAEGENDPWGQANAWGSLGVLHLQRGNRESSRTCHSRSLALREQLGDLAGIASSLEGFARLAVEEREPARAIRLASAALSLRADHELALTEENRREVERTIEEATRSVSPEVATQETQMGATLSAEEAISLALGR